MTYLVKTQVFVCGKEMMSMSSRELQELTNRIDWLTFKNKSPKEEQELAELLTFLDELQN